MKQKLIALMLVLCSVGALLVPQVMAEEKPVSRIEWVRQLVKVFDMGANAGVRLRHDRGGGQLP